MNDPTRPPGYTFSQVRLLRAYYTLSDDAPFTPTGKLEYAYRDELKLQEGSFSVLQTLGARIVDPIDPTLQYLKAEVSVEGQFAAIGNENVSLQEFAEHHAPAILFAFTREWLHRLTSSAGDWPPILLPPMNVLEMRKTQRQQG